MRFKIFIYIAITSQLLSYSAEISLSSENIFIGDMVQILFKVNGLDDGLQAQFPLLNLENDDISIYSGLVNDSSALYQCQFWSKKDIIFPPQKIYITNNNVTLDSIQTFSFPIKINSTISDSSNFIKNIKDNFNVYLSSRIMFAYLAILLLTAVFLAIFSLNRKIHVQPKPLRDYNYLDSAINKINQLSCEDYDMLNIQRLSLDLSSIIKKYIKGTLYINAEEMTSEEIIQFLNNNSKYQMVLKKTNIFEKIDKFKFSNYRTKSFNLDIIKKDAISFLQDLNKVT